MLAVLPGVGSWTIGLDVVAATFTVTEATPISQFWLFPCCCCCHSLVWRLRPPNELPLEPMDTWEIRDPCSVASTCVGTDRSSLSPDRDAICDRSSEMAASRSWLLVVVTTSSTSPVISIRISILLTSSSSSSMLRSSVHLCDASPINVCTLRPLWIKFSDLVAINCHGRVICHLHWYVCERCTNPFPCHF